MSQHAPQQLSPAAHAAGPAPRATAGPAEESLTTLSTALNAAPTVQRLAAMAPNRTGLPDTLKTGVEAMSGMSLDHVRVHRNSAKPAQLNAHAYAQGSDIHLAPGQERHLPHEAWHVVQQAQGRVKPTMQMKYGVPVNDEARLEQEADTMGARAANAAPSLHADQAMTPSDPIRTAVAQRALATDAEILGKKGKTFKWKSFEGERQEGLAGTASELGRGAKLTTGKAVQTEVSWNAADPVTGEGTAMNATIGPDHNLGSKPSAKNAKSRVAAFGWLSGETYISGHLMNEKLGGPGDEGRNLTAISGSANTLQSSNIEKFVRDPVNEHGAWMRYSVSVDYLDDSKVVSADDPKLLRALQTGAKGVTATPIPQTNNATVNVRYASSLNAQWHELDVDGGTAAQSRANSIAMTSPLAALVSASSTPKATAGAATGKDAAKTEILAEELVLTKSDLLKHIVTNRAPLALRIQQLKDNLDLLQDEVGEAKDAYALLMEQAKPVARASGSTYAFTAELAAHRLAVDTGLPDMIDDPEYAVAFKEGELHGKALADKYIAGYERGKDCGWSDLEKNYGSQEPTYKDGYDRGYEDGLQQGDYQAGRRYVFNNISLLLNIHEYGSNFFSHVPGSTTIELTGTHFTQPNRLKWYQIKVVAAEAPGLKEELGRTAWMKRRWLNKGI